MTQRRARRSLVQRALSVLSAFIAMVLTAGACSGSPELPLGPDGEADPELVVGADVYATKCAACHGAEGQGGRGKRLNNGQAEAQYPDPAEMEQVVSDGKGAGMPSFEGQLTDAEIAAVVRYVREVL